MRRMKLSSRLLSSIGRDRPFPGRATEGVHVIRYDAYEDFLAHADQVTNDLIYQGGGLYVPARSDFRPDFHKESYDSSLHNATVGDESYAATAKTLIDQLMAVDYGERTREFMPSVCGAYPIVPEFLAGHPLCMREPRESENLAPVSIYVSTMVNVALEIEQVMNRGAAILALVLKLQQTRPVDLYAVSHVRGETYADLFGVIPIESKPLSLAHAAYALCSTGFVRQLQFKVAALVDNYSGAYSKHFDNIEWIKSTLGLSETDLFIKQGENALYDPLINNPVEWVNTQLEKYNTTE